MQQWQVYQSSVSTIDRVASSVARKRRLTKSVCKISWWTADEIYRKAVIATGESSRRRLGEARNIHFRPAKPILLWSLSPIADRRRSTEMGHIDSVSRWNTCICTSSTAEDTRGVSSPSTNCLSVNPAAIYKANQTSSTSDKRLFSCALYINIFIYSCTINPRFKRNSSV